MLPSDNLIDFASEDPQGLRPQERRHGGVVEKAQGWILGYG